MIKLPVQRETIRQSLQEHALSRISLVRQEARLNRLHGLRLNVVAAELGAEHVEVVKSLLPTDQVGVGNRIGRTREQIGQPHLVAHIRRQDIQRQVKGTGYLLENDVKEFVLGGLITRGAPCLSDFECPLHAFLPVTWEKEEFLVAIEGIGARLGWRKLHGHGFTGAHIPFDRDPGCLIP